MAKTFLREGWYACSEIAWDCDQASTCTWSARNLSSVCKMFIVNQAENVHSEPSWQVSLPAKISQSCSLCYVLWEPTRFPEPVPYSLHGVTTAWPGFSSRTLRAKACLSWAETISLKRDSGIISSVLLQHWQKYIYLRWCLHIPRDACIGSDPEPICYKSLKGHLWFLENITKTTTLGALAGKDSWFAMTNFWLTMSTPGRYFKCIGLPWEISVELECTQQNRE